MIKTNIKKILVGLLAVAIVVTGVVVWTARDKDNVNVTAENAEAVMTEESSDASLEAQVEAITEADTEPGTEVTKNAMILPGVRAFCISI
jgi:hypothetical protein